MNKKQVQDGSAPAMGDNDQLDPDPEMRTITTMKGNLVSQEETKVTVTMMKLVLMRPLLKVEIEYVSLTDGRRM